MGNQNYELDTFTEFFIQMLSDTLSTTTLEDDDLDRYKQLKELYVECMLDAKQEFREQYAA